MKTPVTIAIAEDQEIFLDGLLYTLRLQQHLTITGVACNGKELVELVENTQPDIALTDIMMPVMDGIEACKIIRLRCPATAVVAMTVFEEQGLIMEMLEAGAAGFIMKNSGREELLQVIEKTNMRDGIYCSRTNKKLTEFWGKKNARLKIPALTLREQETLELICEGLSHAAIAKQLCISKKTVDSCSQRLLEKTNQDNAIGLVKYALANGLYKMKW